MPRTPLVHASLIALILASGPVRGDGFSADRAAGDKESLLENFPKWYPRVGDPALDFTRADTRGEPVSLSSLWSERPVVMEFGTCT